MPREYTDPSEILHVMEGEVHGLARSARQGESPGLASPPFLGLAVGLAAPAPVGLGPSPSTRRALGSSLVYVLSVNGDLSACSVAVVKKPSDLISISSILFLEFPPLSENAAQPQ